MPSKLDVSENFSQYKNTLYLCVKDKYEIEFLPENMPNIEHTTSNSFLHSKA
jgi:hypothetical protein